MLRNGLGKESCEISIAEKMQLKTEKDLYQFLTNLFNTQTTFMTPSGLQVSFARYRMPAVMTLSRRWFREISVLPYREELPTIEELFEWSKSEEPACQMSVLDKIYAVFSAPSVTGIDNSALKREKTPFYVKDGRLLCYFSHEKEEQVTIPREVETIGRKSFYCAGFLKHVIIPSTVKMIEEDAFYIEDVESTELLFLEIQSKDTLFDGELSIGCKEYLEEYGLDFRPYLIAPKFSRTWEFAKLRKYNWAENINDAIEAFLSRGRQNEAGEAESNDIYLDKAEGVARYRKHASGRSVEDTD